MKAVVGIGNPGPKYEKTRHNLGFDVIDALARRLRVDLNRNEHGSLVGAMAIRGEPVLLVKPQTFVNLSGQAIRSLVRSGMGPEDLIVVVDDLSLPVGQVRVRPCGGDGGHNGLKSVIEVLGNGAFARLRIGIGPPPAGVDPAEYVLSPFSPDEMDLVNEAIEESARALAVWLRRRDLNMMMNQLNRARVSETREARDETEARDKEEDV